MKNYFALKNLQTGTSFGKGDLLVLFGELFDRGYANGLVKAAEAQGAKVISATVGRRDKDLTLRPLNSNELQEKGVPVINIPLEAGFDLEEIDGIKPVDQLKDIKLSDWQNSNLNFDLIEKAIEKSRIRFNEQVKKFLIELSPEIEKSRNIIFAHLMAGGVPRTKIVLPLMNRAFKGTGDRFLSSETFWTHDIGKLCQKSFLEVSARTYDVLIQLTSDIRQKKEAAGHHVSYLGYGYHGTEIVINGKYQWQTYTPYLQGWAKIELEKYSEIARKNNVKSTIYNCPEILTNSSAIFNGVEVSLYPLVAALKKESQTTNGKDKKLNDFLTECQSLFKPDYRLEDLQTISDTYFLNPIIQAHCSYELWPQHNSKEQLETMLNSSEKLYNMHVETKNLLTEKLSELIVTETGKLMLNHSALSDKHVAWLNHDVIAKSWLE
jgi:hypothetical protein